MFSIQKNILLFVFSAFLSLGNAQYIGLKTPLTDANYTDAQSLITFLWEDNQNSSWQIDIANNNNFIGANSYLSTTNNYQLSISSLNQQTYYWRIRSTTDTSATRSFTMFSLNSLGTLAFHINAQNGANVSNGKVTQWNNLGNTNYNATQSNANFQPEIASDLINNNNMVKFGGDDGSLATNFTLNDFLIADTNFTFISAYKQLSLYSASCYLTGANDFSGVYTGGNFQGGRALGIRDATNNRRVAGQPLLSFNISSIKYNKFYINSNLESNTIGSNKVDYFNLNTIGVRPDISTLNFHGYLGDILIYNEILPDSSRLLVENFLKTKYTPYPDLGKDTVVCGPEIQIGFRTDHGYSSITWSNGQSNTDSITVTQNGTYWVEVESFGWTITDTIEITGIVPVPQISLTNDQVVCFGDSLQVNYTPLAGFTPTWINGQTTNTIFVKDSSQFVQVTHTDINNCSASSASYFISVDSVQLQSTLGDDRNVCDGGNIFVETTSNQGPFEYDWSTGDTTSFTNTTSIGIQNIFVEMTDFNNCIFKDTVQINAINLPAPIVNFVNDTACPNLPTHFTDLSSSGGTDNIIDWKWSFINNDSAFIPNPEYAFPQGTFNASLTVETDSGCINTIVKQIKTHRQPTAKINTPIICAQGESEINSSSFVAVPDNITNFNWLIDGNNYSGSSPEVIFSQEGFNDVQLIVTTDKGCIDTVIKSIEVFPALLADFEVTNVCIGDSTQFTDVTPSFSVIEKEWNFGAFNAINSNENEPKFLYQTPGTYNVTLKVTNAIGCENTISKPINIRELPIANINVDNTCAQDLSLLTDNSSIANGFAETVTWEINGSTFTTDSLQYQFDTVGVQNVYHSITDNFGCFNDSTYQIQINQAPEVDFNFTPNYGTAPIDVNFISQTNNAIDFLWNFGDSLGTSNNENTTYTYTENGFYNIVLTASNQFGCSNSIVKQLIVAPSNLDLEISNLSFTKTVLADGSTAYKPSVLLKNVGTRFITNVDLYAAVNNETKINENWTGSLGIGQAFLYEFTSSFVINNNELLDYLCVKGTNVNDNTEENLSNNTACVVQQGSLQASPIYPNPTNNIAYIDVISADKGTLTLEMYDMVGVKVKAFSNIDLIKGYNKINIDCLTLQAGTYYVNLIYLGETYTQKLIITNQ